MNLGRPSLVSTFALALALAACSEGDSDTSPSDAAALADGGAAADAGATGADASPAADAAPVSPDAAPAMVAGAVSLTINGQPATLAPALMVVPRGLPNVNVTSFKIIAGQGPAANDNAVATLEIFGKMGGLNPGFT